MSQSIFRIERLTLGDETRLRSIRLRALQHDPDAFDSLFEEANLWPRENWRSQLEKLATFVATNGEADVGLVRGTPHDEFPDTAYLISLWVAPEVRRQGLGEKLIGAVDDWSAREGFRRLVLDVAVMNHPAAALYEKLGFHPNGTVSTLPPPREHIQEIQLEKRLALAKT